jgi:hypothetical protein
MSGPGVSREKALATARVTTSPGEQWTKPSADKDAGAYGRSGRQPVAERHDVAAVWSALEVKIGASLLRWCVQPVPVPPAVSRWPWCPTPRRTETDDQVSMKAGAVQLPERHQGVGIRRIEAYQPRE